MTMKAVDSSFGNFSIRTENFWATKYLLSIASKDFKFFLDEMTLNKKSAVLEELLQMSHANEYNKIELYKKNLEQLSIVIPS